MILACAKKYITDRDTYVDFNICMEENIEDLDVSGEKVRNVQAIIYLQGLKQNYAITSNSVT